MQQYSPRLRELLKGNHSDERGVISIGEGGILPIRNVSLNQSPECGKMFEAFDEQLVSNPNIDRVVIAARWSFYFQKGSNWKIDGQDSIGQNPGKQKALDEIEKTFKGLRKLGKKVTLVLTIPTGQALDPKSSFTRGFMGISKRDRGVLTREAFLKENGAILEEITSIAKRNGVEVIDPMDFENFSFEDVVDPGPVRDFSGPGPAPRSPGRISRPPSLSPPPDPGEPLEWAMVWPDGPP
jgi:hypothetical protein